MQTETKEGTTPGDGISPKVKKAIFILAVIGLALLAAFTIIGTVVAMLNRDAVYYAIVIKHYPVTIGLPISALAALVLVFVLEYATGPIEFEGLGFKFKGAAAPLVFWIACFLAINASVATLWGREFHSPIADRFLEELISEQIRTTRLGRSKQRCIDDARSKGSAASSAELMTRCSGAATNE